jgi:hypothetical protein
MPYSEPFETVYKSVVKPVLINCGFKVIRADEIPASTAFADDVLELVRSCDLIIAATSTNLNVYYELGLAHAFKKEVIALADDAHQLPADTRHIRHLQYQADDPDSLKVTLQEWVENTRAFQLKSRKESAKVLNRGDIFTSITDATFYLEHSRGSDDRQEIITCIRNGSLIPPKYLYKFDRGCYLWLDLCNDTEYKYFKNSIEYLRLNIGRIVDSIGADVIRNAPDYISLGPGNGKKDQIILSKILSAQTTRGADMYYYPFDISPTMVASAIQTATSVKSIADSLKIKAIIADFTRTLKSFSPVYQYRTEPNIFSLLGNTLGNIDNETAFLGKLKQAMFPGDYALIEVRLLSERAADIGGSLELNKSFDFTPLDTLGVGYDDEKLTYSTLRNMSTIPDSRTIVASYHDFRLHPDDDVISETYLSYIHEYEPDSLKSVLEDLGFEIVTSFVNTRDGVAFFVLRKPA